MFYRQIRLYGATLSKIRKKTPNMLFHDDLSYADTALQIAALSYFCTF